MTNTYAIITHEHDDGFTYEVTLNGRRLAIYDRGRDAQAHIYLCEHQDADVLANEPSDAEKSHAFVYGYDETN
jgi:hypothetical protein